MCALAGPGCRTYAGTDSDQPLTTTETLQTLLAEALADRYRLERELGHGGMAIVYLARDLKHDRGVAIKVIRPEMASALGAERFLREITIAAALQHPHIVPLFDSGTAAGQLFYVMPYVEGESLRVRLKRERQLPFAEALQITREVADALSYAHSHDVIHRDIKPENIMLSGGHALVADFGIARAITAAGGDTLTESGIAVGTPAYMSPEQGAGDSRLDGRSDIYSLGCVLYEMLAGHAPFLGESQREILARHSLDPVPPLRSARPTVPEPIERAVTRALSKVAADRFPTAYEFAGALERPATITPAPSVSRRAMRRGLMSLSAVAVGLAVWLGVRSVIRPKLAEAATIAVLPFENLGAPADEYFADGMTDAVRGKLAALPGLQVTARASSSQYQRTIKSPQQIGQELGVRYLLTATVRWQKLGGGTSRVQVTPELVRVASATTRWQQPFDAALTDVFQVQADIATEVAQALDVALGDSARQELAERPTHSLAAYDAYLRGEEIAQGLGTTEPTRLRQAVAYYTQAVALDSGFTQAWAQLSRTHSKLYGLSTPKPSDAMAARRAAERTLALAPNRAEGHLALAEYYQYVPKDYAHALEEFARGRRLAPSNADMLAAAAPIEQALGHWDSALVHLQRAVTLDPRSANTTYALSFALLDLRRYPEARSAAERGIALAPTNMAPLETRTMVELAQGDLPEARAVLAAAEKRVHPAALVAHFANFWDLYWVLDEAQQQLLLHLTPSAFDDDRGIWGLVLAQTYWLRGDRARARAFADTARIAFSEQLQVAPEDWQRHVQLGLALAYLGRKPEAVQEGQRGVAAVPITKDGFAGPYFQHQLARIYILMNEPEKALDQIEPLLKIPYYLSPGWLKIDPNFAPLRGNPRFERLIRGP